MPGKRQPTDLIVAKGRKHLSAAEEAERRRHEVQLPAPKAAEPPKWLPKKLHAEFRAVGAQLCAAGLYAALDADTLAMYFLSRERWIRADKLAAAAIREGNEKSAREWTSVQGSYFTQARKCAEAMGLSVTSRCRLVLPQGTADDEEKNPFLQLIEGGARRA